VVNLRQTYVIDDCISEDFQEKIINSIIYQSWKLAGYNKKYFPAGQKNDPYPPYSFGLTIKKEDNIFFKEIYEEVSLPIVDCIRKSVNIKEKDIILNRGFLQLPLAEKHIKQSLGIHLDNDKDHYVAVYYLFDSDGDTIIYEQTKYDVGYKSEDNNSVNPSSLRLHDNTRFVEHARVSPKKGRVVLFDGSRWHCSSQPRNNLRCILNFNLV
jgi:hypothetical protein